MISITVGRQSDPLQEKILEQAVANYRQHPERKTFIIIPNHIKFTTEVRAINMLATQEGKQEAAVSNLQILSFSRLAWYFLKQEAGTIYPKLDDAACSMLIEQILQKRQDELVLLGKSSENSGLITQLYQTILTFHSAKIDFDQFDLTQLDDETRSKLHDLKLVYQDFEKEIAGKFVTKDEVELRLNELLAKNPTLNEMDFYFSDFSHFTPQEMQSIKLLALHAANLHLAFKTKTATIQNSQPGDYDYVVQTTIKQIIAFLKAKNLNYQLVNWPLAPKLSASAQLNAAWSDQLPYKKGQTLKQVQLVVADSRYAEAYFAVRTIYQQVALQHYRYQDFLILAPNLKEYETYLLPILRQNKIPYFNDLQQEMKYHPLVILIENLAALSRQSLNTASLLAIMKTQLIIPDFYRDPDAYRHDVDELENFALAHGINHQLWQRSLNQFTDAQVIYLDQKQEEVARLDRLRQFFLQQLEDLEQKLTQENDCQKAVAIFFNFLVKNKIPERLEEWRQQSQEEGDLQKAQQPQQLWQLLLTLLHDYLMLEKRPFEQDNFYKMLISAFKAADFAQIPSSLDAVNLSETGMVQRDGYAQVFILGASSNALPQIQNTPGFLTSENIASLKKFDQDDIYLEDRQKLNNLDQNYQFGNLLALAQERVFVSYPRLNTENERLEPSIYYNKLKNLGAVELQQAELPDDKQNLLSFITNAQASSSYLLYLDKTQPSAKSHQLLKLVRSYQPQEMDRLEQANKFTADPINLGSKLAQELYGHELNTSVSQLETFYENSAEYFYKYGLHLRTRNRGELDLSQAGNYFHETFDRLVKEANQAGLDLAQLNLKQLDSLLKKARQTMRQEAKYQQLAAEPLTNYLFTCLDRTSDQVAHDWYRRLQQTPLKPRYSELSFGPGEKLAGLSWQLEPDLEVVLRGKIDRVDLLDDLAQVIDYKSSAKSFDLASFFNGLNLQMISYLDILAKHPQFFDQRSSLNLVGGFYQTITRKLNKLNSKELLTPSLSLKADRTDSKKRLQYNGLITNEADWLIRAEPLLAEPGQQSTIYNQVKTTKKGSFSLPKDHNFNQEEMRLLLAFDEYLIKQAGNQILHGEIKLNPYRLNQQRSALTYSDYKDIFFFDAKLGKQRYHQIQRMSKAELLTAIKEILSGKEQNNNA